MGLFSSKSDGAAVTLDPEKAADISAITGDLQSKHGEQVKRGRGRPPGSKTKTAPPGGNVGENVAANAPAPEKPVSPEDVLFVKKTAGHALEILSKYVESTVYRKINLIGDANIQSKAESYARQVIIGENDIALVSEAAGALAVKYPFLGAYAPEMVIVGWATTYGMTCMSVLKSLDQLTLEVKKLNASRSSANQNLDSRNEWERQNHIPPTVS